MLKELKQLHDMEVVEPVKAGSLSTEQKHMHWSTLCSSNENVVVRSREEDVLMDANNEYICPRKNLVHPPHPWNQYCSQQSLMQMSNKTLQQLISQVLLCRQIKMNWSTCNFMGTMAALLSMVDSDKYRKHLVHENGESVLYVVQKKAMYRMLRAALLFWQ